MPPPEPRSSTTSPAFSLANAVGLPQPSDAIKASSGICPDCAASYRFVVIGSQPPRLAVAPQHELPPDFTRNAASPYFSFTTCLMSVGLVLMTVLLFTDSNDLFRF